jgi:hypothetical protein
MTHPYTHIAKINESDGQEVFIDEDETKGCRSLRFSWLFLDSELVAELDLSSLVCLKLDKCDLIPNLLSSLPTTLEKLDMGRSTINGKIIEKLASSLQKLTLLKELGLGNTTLKQEGIEKLITCFPSFSVLSSLDLGYNFFHDEGAAELAKGLPSLTKLTELNLAGNHISYEGIALLAPFLSKLERINVADNLLNDKSVVLLVKSSPRLISLDVSGSVFGDDGAKALAFGLPNLKHLLVMRCYWPMFVTDISIQAIVNLLWRMVDVTVDTKQKIWLNAENLASLLVFCSGYSPSHPTATSRLLNADGDHAICNRVGGWLLFCY